MAFDMYFKNRKTSIAYHEEEIFLKVNEDERFPSLNWLWENFYNGPSISPEKANDIAHELILLKSICNQKNIIFVIDKLLPFLSMAYKLDEVIITKSD